MTAIALLFGSFFMFNISYPVEASATMEFMQRVILSINPGKGSKVAKARGKKARSGPPDPCFIPGEGHGALRSFWMHFYMYSMSAITLYWPDLVLLYVGTAVANFGE